MTKVLRNGEVWLDTKGAFCRSAESGYGLGMAVSNHTNIYA